MELKVVATKRSGYHGIVNWLLAQRPLKNNTVFLNNKKPSSNTLEDAEHLLISYEDVDLFSSDEIQDEEVTYVLILRDPFNTFASRIIWPWGKTVFKDLNEKNRFKIVNLWKQHAREYLRHTCYLPNKICISFNDWFSYKSYRRRVARSLGLEFSDEGLNTVSRYGGGSSFDGLRYNENAQEMDVLTRYKEVLSNPLYNAIFKDEELLQLSDAIFKSTPIGGKNQQ